MGPKCWRIPNKSVNLNTLKYFTFLLSWLNGSRDHFSFGMGPRKCIGSELALIFLKMALSKICGRFKLISLENQAKNVQLFFLIIFKG
jgi:cytochrome P450